MTLEEFRAALRRDPVSEDYADRDWFMHEAHFGTHEVFNLSMSEGFVLTLDHVTTSEFWTYEFWDVEPENKLFEGIGPYSLAAAVEVFKQNFADYVKRLQRAAAFANAS